MRTLLLILLLIPAAPLGAAEIRGLTATERRGRIDVRFELGGGFDLPEIASAVRSGVPTGFTYQLQLIRKRPNWFDTHVDEARIDVVVSYNSLTGEYLLNYRRNRKLVRSEVVSSLDEVVRRMTVISEPELFALSGYPPYKLRVRVRAEIIRDWLLYVVPRAMRTEWVQTRVRTLER